MNQLRKGKYFVALFLVVLLVAACAPKEVVLAPEQEGDRAFFEAKNAHNDAVIRFTQSMAKYNLWCANDEYKDACAKVDPLWLKANKVLDTWGALVDAKAQSAGAEENFQQELKALKSKLLMEIPTYAW